MCATVRSTSIDDPAGDRPRISLIIPAHNEEAYLPRLLDTVDAARARYRGGATGIEVIVADDASTDATAELARRRGCRVVGVSRRLIAATRNAGARAAGGEVLAFVDADMRIHPDTFNGIDDALASGGVVAGATGVRPERWSLGIAVTFALLIGMVWVLKIDTGVVFCRREDFVSIGGYDESLPIAEDVRFLWDLKRRGRRRGQHLVRLRRFKATASMRKFDRFGDWHYFPLMWRGFRTLLLAPDRLGEFAETYWYGRQRPSADASPRSAPTQERTRHDREA
jgi:glycosyltransferase involved in cell wall biosynthesis